MYADFKAGTYRLPEFIYPDTCCEDEACHQDTEFDMTVYSSISAMKTKYIHRFCSNCDVCHRADGKKYGLLVLTNKVLPCRMPTCGPVNARLERLCFACRSHFCMNAYTSGSFNSP